MLDQHVKSAHTKQTFLCDICSNSFSRKDALSRHLKTAHRPTIATNAAFLCDICNNSFSRKDALSRHLKTAHRPTIVPNTVSDRSGPSLHCNACQLTFSSQRKYDTHMKGHRASPTFPCMQCEKNIQ